MDHLTALLYALAALCTALASLVGALAFVLRRRNVELQRRDDRTDERVDLLWDALRQRGRIKNRQAGRYHDDERPMLKLKEEFRAHYEPVAPALRALRRANPAATDSQLAELIQTKYGAWLVTHICDVLGVFDFECFDMAVSVANEPDTPSPAPTG